MLYECLDLYHRGFINFAGEVAFGLTVQGLGSGLFNLMSLESIPEKDLVPIAAVLK